MKTLAKLRRSYHDNIGSQIVRISKKAGQSYPNFADGSSQSSVLIANSIVKELGPPVPKNPSITGQTAGTLFEKLTCEFIEDAVTAEPLPMRIASLALGTGDLDCVYHFALDELRRACETLPGGEDQLEMLETMIQGNRLRDISDLPFDLAV
jgi:hypothetical protein